MFDEYLQSILKGSPVPPPKASPADWQALAALVEEHGIGPLLHWRLLEASPEVQPPEELARRLRQAFMESRVRSIQVETQLGEVLEPFRAAGVEALVLKGTSLGRLVYPDPALRPSRDLDILVRPQQLAKARAVLQGLGYTSQAVKDHHEVLAPPAGQAFRDVLELHWDLIGFPVRLGGSDIDGLFSRAVDVQATGRAFRALALPDALSYAAAHLMFHRWRTRLIWVYDFAVLAESLSAPDDWQLLESLSKARGNQLSLAVCIVGARRWTGLTLPAGWEHIGEPAAPARTDAGYWRSALCPWMFDLKQVGRCQALCNAQQIHHCHLERLEQVSPSLGTRILLELRLLFPKPSAMRRRYPPSHPWLLPASYVKRWLVWLKRAFMGAQRPGRP